MISQTVSSQWCSLMKQECSFRREYCIVGTNGRERLGRTNPIDDYILALAVARASECVKIEMALVGDRGPFNRINGVDHFVFVVKDSNIIVKDFLDLGKEVHMDESHFLRCISIFG